MNTEALNAWCAGLFDGVGSVSISPEVGPTGKPYHALNLWFVGLDPDQGARLKAASGNGEFKDSEGIYLLSGSAAVRGFIRDLWPYLTAHSRSRVNESIRAYKHYRAVDRAA